MSMTAEAMIEPIKAVLRKRSKIAGMSSAHPLKTVYAIEKPMKFQSRAIGDD